MVPSAKKGLRGGCCLQTLEGLLPRCFLQTLKSHGWLLGAPGWLHACLRKASGKKALGIAGLLLSFQAISAEVGDLQKALANAKNKHIVIEKMLAQNDQAINKTLQDLQATRTHIQPLQAKINAQNQAIAAQQHVLKQQQALLMAHVRFCYRMRHQTLGWIVNPTQQYTLNQLLHFHRYVIESREKVLRGIKALYEQLAASQRQLQTSLNHQLALQTQLHQLEASLQRDKRYHLAVIKTLDSDISTKQKLLARFAASRHEPLPVIKTTQAVATSSPFALMQHRLPAPVHGVAKTPSQQGLLFQAKEGTPVYAVHAGKVVFSEWLKGYGLLTIIDHGQGFMTLYAHQQSLLVHTGEMVTTNQPIGTVGHSGRLSTDGLYFEVRKHARVVSASRWLA